ncbi:hypothetical protein ACDP63_17450, partial [Paracoccus sp. P2]|uniref:hypothetical protein n=1 Tax=Paracoccus sp. P2 TaxID=3248840 RepID=UPI00391FAD67
RMARPLPEPRRNPDIRDARADAGRPRSVDGGACPDSHHMGMVGMVTRPTGTLTLQLGGEYSRLTTPGNSGRNIQS